MNKHMLLPLNDSTGSIGWNQGTVCRESYDATSASTVATTATMAFNGAQVHLHGNTQPNHGIAAVSIDDGDEVMVVFRAPAAGSRASIPARSFGTDSTEGTTQ